MTSSQTPVQVGTLEPEVSREASRFWRKVDRSGDCWLWTGSTDGRYGTFATRTHRNGKAHRWSYAHFVGPIPEGLDVCHRCDNPPCVNPAHLFVGTRRENVQDSIAKGRFHTPRKKGRRGEIPRNAKLTEADVRSIRALLAEGRLTQKEIGARYGVSQTQVGNISRMVCWGRVA